MKIAASNFIEDKIPQDHPANKKLVTYGYQKFVGMMQDEFGKDVDFYPIHRSLISITDYTTLLISPGQIITHCKENETTVYSVNDKKIKCIKINHVMMMMMKMKNECVSKLPLTLLLKGKCLTCMLQYQFYRNRTTMK